LKKNALWWDLAQAERRQICETSEHECLDALLAELRASEEWTSVEREIDIRSSKGAHVSGHGHWPDRRITRPARPCHTPLLCPRQRHPATLGMFSHVPRELRHSDRR
jgi:hypothetical protein